MNPDSVLQLLGVVFAVLLAIIIYFVATKGATAFTLGGKLERDYGAVELTKMYRFVGRRIQISKIASGRQAYIAFALRYKFPRYPVTDPLALSKEEAQRLVQLLTLAINET